MVNGLSAIGAKIIEIPFTSVGSYRFPSVFHDRFVTIVKPPEMASLDDRILSKSGDETFSRRIRAIGSNVFRSSDIQDSRHDIDDVPWSCSHLTARGNTVRPGDDHWSRYSTFVGPGFVAAKGSVTRGRPTGAKTEVSLCGTWRGGRIMSVAADHDLGRSAIIRQEHYEGVFPLPHFFDLLKNAAYLDVHPMDHRGVNRHFVSLKFLLLLGE